MPIYDNDGTANREIGKLYDNNGSANTQIGKVYDNNGNVNSLVYQYAAEKKQEIYNTSTKGGWWSHFGTGEANGMFRYYIGNGIYRSPWIDLTNYKTVKINLFVQLPNGGTVTVYFGITSQANPNGTVWSVSAGNGIAYGAWKGPSISNTFDLSSFSGVYRLQQETVASDALAHTYLSDSHFIYLEYT